MTTRRSRRLSLETLPGWIAPAVIVLSTLALYWQTLGHGFFNFDDTVYVTENPMVLRGLNAEGFYWSWSTCLTGMWHPLTWLSLMANVSLFGQGARGFHAVNIALHTANAVLLYALLKKATGDPLRSLIVALLFALHPLNVESVAWVSQRKSTLSALFCLTALYSWVHYVRSGKSRSYLLAWFCFLLALLTKPILVGLPALFLLLELWPLEPRKLTWKQRGRELLPFLALSALSSWICIFPFGPTDVRVGGPLFVFSDVMNVPLNVVSYLGKLIYPTELCVFYPRRADWSPGLFLLCSVPLLICITIIILKRNRLWLMATLWFLICVGPVLGVISFGFHCMADRYLYLPAIGLFIGLVWSLPSRAFVGWLLAATLLLFAALAYAQIGLWRTTSALWLRTSSLTTESPVTLLNTAVALLEQDRTEEAIPMLRRLSVISPGEHRAWMNLGYLEDRRGHKQEALACLRKASLLAPNDARVHNHLGSVLQDLGKLNEAEQELRAAIQLRPDYADPWINLGVLFASKGDLNAAIRAFEKALDIQPLSKAAQANLALAKAQLNSSRR